jgi:hypothetical protein
MDVLSWDFACGAALIALAATSNIQHRNLVTASASRGFVVLGRSSAAMQQPGASVPPVVRQPVIALRVTQVGYTQKKPVMES